MMSAAAAWWPPSSTLTATSSVCSRTDEQRTPLPRPAPPRHRTAARQRHRCLGGQRRTRRRTVPGAVEILPMDALPRELGDRFAVRTGFDPRVLAAPYRWFRITPRRIQAWREANELAGRTLMREGRWLV